ncbi:sialate O-acetylesterase [Spirosoma luteolum]
MTLFRVFLSGLGLLLLGKGPAIGQRIANLYVAQTPAKLALIPRDPATGLGQVGVTLFNYSVASQLSMLVYCDGKPYAYTRDTSRQVVVRLNAPLKAQLCQYRLAVFAHTGKTDSTLVHAVDSLVCGDVYVIAGQSNAVGRFDQNAYRSPYARTLGRNLGNVPNNYDSTWYLSNTGEGQNSLWGIELQRYIEQNHGIPTAVINGAVGSTDLLANLPGPANYIYDNIRWRLQKGNLADKAFTMIWRQGEAEASNNTDTYPTLYERLLSTWRRDYPKMARVYMPQLNILTDVANNAGSIREFQRRIGEIYANHVTLATIGLPGYQGLHYSEAGYRQFGLELYRLIARDNYRSADTSNISSPNLRRLFYSKPDYSELTLEFEPGQELRWQADTLVTNPANNNTYSRRMTDFIYTDFPTGESGVVQSGVAQGNRVVLTLSRPVVARTLTYLPSSYKDNELGYYAGPTLKNRRGMRALSFHQVPITAPLPVATDLRAVPLDTTAIRLSWNQPISGVEGWLVERADSGGVFRTIASVSPLASNYDDRRRPGTADSLRIGRVYRYRIRAISKNAEAAYSPEVSASLQVVLAIKPGQILPTGEPDGNYTSALLYPNPASDLTWVRMPPEWAGGAVLFTLTNSAGVVVMMQTRTVRAGTARLPVSVASLPTGSYVLTIRIGTGVLRERLVIAR